MSISALPVIYQGSVKDLRGPVKGTGHGDALIFDYTDAYSVFDWGKMPDPLPHKGEALAIIAADWFEKIERAETWKEFSKSQSALSLRRGNRFGASFNELGEILQAEGLRTHYLGAVGSSEAEIRKTDQVKATFKQIAVKAVSVVKPKTGQLFGRTVCDYTATRETRAPRLIPLEVVFRFSCPPGSSLLERVERDPQYLNSIGYSGLRVAPGEKWDFPIIELFTKLESTDRLLTLSEGLAISGVTAEKLQEVLFKTAWIAGWIRSVCSDKGLELADGKLEWAIDEKGSVMLVDAIGPDELRILNKSVQLSKEFLRTFYRATPWYARVTQAKKDAQAKGSSDWKRGVGEGPEGLTPECKELASQLYQSLANTLTDRAWFPGAWSLSQVTQKLGEKFP